MLHLRLGCYDCEFECFAGILATLLAFSSETSYVVPCTVERLPELRIKKRLKASVQQPSRKWMLPTTTGVSLEADLTFS